MVCFGTLEAEEKKQSVASLLKRTRDLMTKSAEKTETLNIFFAFIYEGKTQERPAGKSEERKIYTQWNRKNQVRDHLKEMDISRFTRPHGLHPPVLRSWLISLLDLSKFILKVCVEWGRSLKMHGIVL